MEQDIEKYKLDITKINQRIKEFLWKARYKKKTK